MLNFSRNSSIAAILASSAIFGSQAIASSPGTHYFVAEAAGATTPYLATTADLFDTLNSAGRVDREFLHYTDSGKDPKQVSDFIHRTLDVGSRNPYDQAHMVLDMAQPGHVSPYDWFNKKWHARNDAVLLGYDMSRLKDVPAATGDVYRNMESLIAGSVKLDDTLRRERRMMTRQESYSRAVEATKIIKQMKLSYAQYDEKIRALGSVIGKGASSKIMNRTLRSLAAASVITGSVLFGGMAQAGNVVTIGNKSTIIERSVALKSITDRIAQGSKSASSMYYETAIHESGGLIYNRQMIGKGKGYHAGGVARSIFMMEPSTAFDLIKRAKNKPKLLASMAKELGISGKKLLTLSKSKIADLLMKHDHFSAAVVRAKYFDIKAKHGSIPNTLEKRASYWSKYYQGKNNPAKEKKFIANNKAFSKRVSQKLSPTAGLVNKGLHSQKIGSKHGTASSKAYKSIKKILQRT